ncbi:hypothetical protein Fmac_022954 [Flemingia macrophylla]|uniref:beta-N-acetylhexosaminidase n=1 Tax=Flemingia macrophylla TaxID=520843 RepID=A0ABD1LK78_9FABA
MHMKLSTFITGINVMAEVDVPGHAASWGVGYPDLWPSPSCKEPLDVSKKFTFDVLSGILTDMRKIFPFELFHLGGDEVDTECWSNTTQVKKWLRSHNMTGDDAYQYFVLMAQKIALAKNWSPVNWLGPGVCPKAVAKGFRCIFSNQGVWYLDHLDTPWDAVYTAEPLEGIQKASEQKLVLGGEVCMWGETADTSDVQQTIWPRAAAAAERLWSQRDYTSGNANITALPRLQYFRCLLNRRGVPAAPVTNLIARTAPRKNSEGFRVFNDLKDGGYFPDRVLYTTVIKGLSEMGLIGEARKLWFEMIKKGLQPNEYTFNVLMHRYSKTGDLVEARKIFEDMHDRGYAETAVSYSTLISGLRTDEVLSLFKEMYHKGIVCDLVTYNSLINGLCKKGELVKATKLLNELLAQGLEPSVFSFNPLIKGLCEVGDT